MSSSFRETIPGFYFPVFVAGACALLIEIAGGRMLAPYVGMGIYTWAAVIAAVLASLSIGYYLGGWFADRHQSKDELGRIFLLASIATLAIPFFFKIVGPLTLVLDLVWASLVTSFALVPASLLYGMISPYAIKLAIQRNEEGTVAGSIFALSTAGSILGALGTGFILIPHLPLTHVFILAAASMLACSWLIARRVQPVDALVFLALVLLTSQIGFAYFAGTLLYETDSPYYHISVVNGTYNDQPGTILILNNALSSGEASNGSSLFEYVREGRNGYALSRNPRTALVLGVGAGTQLEDLKRTFPALEVDGVEIDPQVLEVGMHFFSLHDDRSDARTHLVVGDARRYLQQTNRSYDIIVMDVYRGTSIPPHLATREFVSALRRRLQPDGVVIVNVISALDGPNSKPFQLLRNTYAEQFRRVLVLPIHKENATAIQNVLLIVTDQSTSGAVNDFEQRFSSRLYAGIPNDSTILTDEQNPIDLYMLR